VDNGKQGKTLLGGGVDARQSVSLSDVHPIGSEHFWEAFGGMFHPPKYFIWVSTLRNICKLCAVSSFIGIIQADLRKNAAKCIVRGNPMEQF
jgi:hypothetical protein